MSDENVKLADLSVEELDSLLAKINADKDGLKEQARVVTRVRDGKVTLAAEEERARRESARIAGAAEALEKLGGVTVKVNRLSLKATAIPTP